MKNDNNDTIILHICTFFIEKNEKLLDKFIFYDKPCPCIKAI